MSNLVVSNLCIYPVKSFRNVDVNSTQLDFFGLKNDRRWMVIDEQGDMLTQRKISRMCLIQPEVTDNGIILRQSALKPLRVKIPLHNNKTKVKIWSDLCDALDAGDAVANWISKILLIKCRLVYFPNDEFRQVDLNYAEQGDKTAFSDGFPLLLISQESLDDLNERLTNKITMNRFRPNIVVQGCAAFSEDSWKNIRIGDINYKVVKSCSRCVIPSINIETAEREDEPIKTLIGYRKKDDKIFFGQNLIADSQGKIEVGMPVEILN